MSWGAFYSCVHSTLNTNQGCSSGLEYAATHTSVAKEHGCPARQIVVTGTGTGVCCHDLQVSVFGEMFREMLQLRYGRGLLRALNVLEAQVSTRVPMLPLCMYATWTGMASSIALRAIGNM